MKVCIKTAIRLFVLLILQTPWLGAAYCQAPGNPADKEEKSKQEAIYQGKGEGLLEGYVINRSLLSYAHTLHTAFDGSLANLGPEDRWLDIGAGEGNAVLDYYGSRYDAMHAKGMQRRGSKARAVAISIEDRRTTRWHQIAAGLEVKKIQYFSGRRLREYSPGELGRFQLITDVLGGFSYTSTLNVFMERALSVLAAGGEFYTLLQNVQPAGGRNEADGTDSPFLTEITNADGSELKVCSWLKNIACAEVVCEVKANWQPAIEVYRIRKICDDVSVPALTAVRIEAGTPPKRVFRAIKNIDARPRN